MRFWLLIILLVCNTTAAQEFSLLSWNIDSGDSDPAVIKKSLERMRFSFDIVALCDVPADGRQIGAIYSDDSVLMSKSGNNSRLLIAWNAPRFTMVEEQELNEWNGVQLGGDDSPAPLIVTLKHTRTNVEFRVVNNHFAGVQSKRQSEALVDWARSQSLPILAVGSYKFDYNIQTQTGNEAFATIQRDDVFKWIRPLQIVDTEWTDKDQDGKDDAPDLMQDFVFAAGATQKWDIRSKVLVIRNDFPDDATTSDHRPVLTKVNVLD